MDSDAPRSAGWYDILGWFETNKKQVGIGAGAFLVVALVIGFFVWRSSETQFEAERALASVRMPLSPIDVPAPGTADALAKVAQDYPETPAAAKALLRAGSAYFGEGNFAKAREQFDTYIRTFGTTPFVAQAVFGVAACLDAENKVAEAITKYAGFISSYPSDPSVDQARLNLARLYEKNNQPQLALETLSKMTNPQQGYSPLAGEAQEKIRALMMKHPSLMPSNPAPQTQIRPAVPSRPLVLKPEEPVAPSVQTPNIIVNPNQPTPGQPAPTVPTPTVPTPNPPAPGQPVPAQPVPVQPAPAPAVPAPTPGK